MSFYFNLIVSLCKWSLFLFVFCLEVREGGGVIAKNICKSCLHLRSVKRRNDWCVPVFPAIKKEKLSVERLRGKKQQKKKHFKDKFKEGI